MTTNNIAIVEQTQVAFIPEVTPGTTPATPAFQVARIKGESLTTERKFVYSAELNGFRGQKNAAIAESHGAGSIDFEFTAGSLETFLQYALRNTWTANVITDSNLIETLTVETFFQTGTTPVYKRLTGAQIDTMSLTMKPGDVVTGSCGFMALTGDYANSIITGATYTPGNTNPINVGANVGSIALAGLTFDAVTQLSMEIKNNIRLQDALNGSVNPFAMAAGLLEITGSLGIYVNSTMYNVLRAACDGTGTGLTFIVGNATGLHTKFELPNIILEQPKADASSSGQDVLATFNYRALQSSTIEQSVIRVTRNQ